eukprot:g4661.t1
MDRTPQPPSSNNAVGGNNLSPGIGARTVVRRRSGGKHFARSLNSKNPTREELHNGPTRKELPKEVQEMERQDTVCKFCGVSYLVFSEIKELEKRLEDSENKIKQYSKRLKDFEKLKRQLDQLHQTQKNTQKNQIAILEEEWIARTNALSAKVEMLEEECKNQRFKGNKAKLFMDKQRRALSKLKYALKREKEQLVSIRNDAGANIKDMGLLMQSTFNEVQVMALRLKKEIEAREQGDELRKTMKGQIEILEEEWKSDVRRLEEQLREKTNAAEETHLKIKEDMEKEHEQEISLMKAQLENEITKSQDLRTELKKMERNAQQLGTSHDEKHRIMSNDLNNMKNKVSQQEDEIKELSKQMVLLKNKLQNAKTELNEMKDENKHLTKENTRLKNDLLLEKSTSKSTIQNLETFLNSANDEIKVLQENGKSNKEMFSKEIAALENKLSEALAKLKDVENEYENFKNVHKNDKSLASEMQEKLDAAKAEYRSQIERLKHQHRIEMEALKKECVIKVEQVRTDCKDEMDGYIEQKNAAQNKARALEVENKNLLEELESEKNRFMALMDQVKQLNQQISEKDENLKEALAEKVNTEKELKSKQWEIERLRAEMEDIKGSQNKETTDGLEMLERHLIKLSEKIRKKDQEIGNLEATVHRQCRERQGLLDELKHYRRNS